MVTPVTGPFSLTRYTVARKAGINNDYRTRQYTRTWYRQKRPFDRPLQFSFQDRDARTYWDRRVDYSIATYDGTPTYDDGSRTRAYNRAYDNLKEKVGEASQWSVNLLEGRQAVDSLASRANQLLRFSRQLRKKQFKAAARTLLMKDAPKKALKKKSFADNWLEYHFGWEPLVKDIGAAIRTICDPYSDEWKLITGRGRDSGSRTTNLGYEISTVFTETSVRAQLEYRVANPNLHLLQQLGFVNPLSIAWELVPFSFVLDWFSNVGQVLDSWSDWVGLETRNPFTSHKQRSTRTFTAYATSTIWQSPPIYRGEGYCGGVLRSIYVERRLGVSGPTIKGKNVKSFSVTRGATAIALLTQFLKH